MGKINYGKKDLLPEHIDYKDVTVRISMMIEADLLREIKTQAKFQKMPYQTFMKQVLRDSLMAPHKPVVIDADMAAALQRLVERIAEEQGTIPKAKKRA